MNKISLAVVAVLLIMVGCNKPQIKKTPNGFEYTVLKAGDGVLPKVGEILAFNFTMKDSKDSIWQETYKAGLPAAVMIADTAQEKTENGMVQMFRKLSKGDSVKVEMP